MAVSYRVATGDRPQDQTLVTRSGSTIRTASYYRQIKKLQGQECALVLAPKQKQQSESVQDWDRVIARGSFNYCCLLTQWLNQRYTEKVLRPPYDRLKAECMFMLEARVQ